MSEEKRLAVLRQLVDRGEVTPPVEHGMPDPVPDLAYTVDCLSDLLIEDRDNDRRS